MQAQDRDRILSLAAEVERLNPLPDATRHLDRVAGRWRLLFSTITILVRSHLFVTRNTSCSSSPLLSVMLSPCCLRRSLAGCEKSVLIRLSAGTAAVQYRGTTMGRSWLGKTWSSCPYPYDDSFVSVRAGQNTHEARPARLHCTGRLHAEHRHAAQPGGQRHRLQRGGAGCPPRRPADRGGLHAGVGLPGRHQVPVSDPGAGLPLLVLDIRFLRKLWLPLSERVTVWSCMSMKFHAMAAPFQVAT